MNWRKEKPLFDKSWKDITMRTGIELAQLEIEDPLELIKMQMAVIMDEDMDHIEKLPMGAIIEFTKEYEFIGKLPEKRLTKTIKHNGKTYGICDFDKMSLAQFVDIEEYYNNGLLPNLHKILSVFYLPIKKRNIFTGKYELEEYEPNEERENMFLDMDMEFIWSITLFFYHIGQEYIRLMKLSLDQQNLMVKTMGKMKEEER